MKAVRSLEIGAPGLVINGVKDMTDHEIDKALKEADDRRLFILAEAMRRGMLDVHLQKATGIDPFFLGKIRAVVEMEQQITRAGGEGLTPAMIMEAKRMGCADAYIARSAGVNEDYVRELRLKNNIKPVYKMVDTCAAEFEALTPYYYSCYDCEDEAAPTEKPKVVVLGGGPIRIGQGIEFDYCSVHSVWAIREEGLEAIIINNNPETVSTDFDTADRLYFEPLLAEDVLNILDNEKPRGVIVQFGGQTPINLAARLHKAGIKILGTSVEDTDRAEDREKFDSLLVDLGIPKPPGKTAFSVEEAQKIAANIGFPVLVRPSYVLGGRAMEIVYNNDELLNYMATAVMVTPEHPVLVDKYLLGQELEVDAIADGETVLIPGIMRHVERAGVHSGDSIAVYPTSQVEYRVKKQIEEYTKKLALALNVRGMINIQYVLHNRQVYVLEVNPRASRTVPYMSKITGIPMVSLATKAILGRKLKDLGYTGGLYRETSIIGVKAPVFSFSKLLQVDVTLGPEMKSTGEVMGVDHSYPRALYKALVAAGYSIPAQGTVLATIADKDKDEAFPLIRGLTELGFKICATGGTAAFLKDKGLPVERVNKVREGSPNIADLIRAGKINMVLSTLTRGKAPERDGFQIRRVAVEYGVPCLTSLDTAWALLEVMTFIKEGDQFDLVPLQEYGR
jgi:carbamoyl-phosphate synthase large subunit